MLFFGLLMFSHCDTEDNIELPFKQSYIRMYGQGGEYDGVSMAISKSNEIFLLGQRTDITDRRQAYVVKTDSEGNQLWDIVLNADTDYFPKDIIIDNQGRVCVVVNYFSDATTTNVRLIRIADNGTQANKIDSVSVGVSGFNENVNTITAVTDGSYILAGSTFQQFAEFDVNDVKIASWRFDSNLVPFSGASWNFNVSGFSNYSEVTAIFQGTTSPFYAFGSTNTVNLTGVNNQNPITSNLYAGSVETFGDVGAPIGRGNSTTQNFLTAVKKISGNRYLLLGTSNNASSQSINRFNEQGDIYFALVKEELSNPFLAFENPKNLNLGSALVPRDIAESKGGSILICAENLQNIPRGSNIMIYKLDAAGIKIWERIIDVSGDYSAAKIYELSDGKILMLGTAGLINQRKMMLVKLNQNGEFLP
jgi:hypothetical protein